MMYRGHCERGFFLNLELNSFYPSSNFYRARGRTKAAESRFAGGCFCVFKLGTSYVCSRERFSTVSCTRFGFCFE